jgi:hypothetical protein
MLTVSMSDAGLVPARKAKINLATIFAAAKLCLNYQIYIT